MKYAKLKSFRSLVLLASASSISHLLSSQRHIVHLQTSHHTPEAPLAACPRAHPCWIICIQVHETHMHEVLLLAIHPKVGVASAVVVRQTDEVPFSWVDFRASQRLAQLSSWPTPDAPGQLARSEEDQLRAPHIFPVLENRPRLLGVHPCKDRQWLYGIHLLISGKFNVAVGCSQEGHRRAGLQVWAGGWDHVAQVAYDVSVYHFWWSCAIAEREQCDRWNRT